MHVKSENILYYTGLKTNEGNLKTLIRFKTQSFDLPA